LLVMKLLLLEDGTSQQQENRHLHQHQGVLYEFTRIAASMCSSTFL
jgi:hypothetical protein